MNRALVDVPFNAVADWSRDDLTGVVADAKQLRDVLKGVYAAKGRLPNGQQIGTKKSGHFWPARDVQALLGSPTIRRGRAISTPF